MNFTSIYLCMSHIYIYYLDILSIDRFLISCRYIVDILQIFYNVDTLFIYILYSNNVCTQTYQPMATIDDA